MPAASSHARELPAPILHGVDHTARPTWKLRETVHFYRDILGLPLVHAITAKGWGRKRNSMPTSSISSSMPAKAR